MSEAELDVSACILSLNRPVYLREAVASMQSQTKSPKEIVIYDNGSKEDVFAAVEDYIEMGVRWRGAEYTRNVFWNFRRVVAEVKSKYVVVLHDDDRLCPDFLDKQVSFMESNPSVVAVSCNGYLIDENGQQNGRTLLPIFGGGRLERYKCSGDVAMRYASDSCIPISPVVYRSEILRRIDLREDYDKVSDVVFFCDMADAGEVVYLSSPLYECRIHAGQDSSFFSPAILDKLENFLWTRVTKTDADLVSLHKQIITQHTSRNIRRFLNVLKQPQSFRQLFSELGKVWDGVFSPTAALRIVTNAATKRVGALWRKSSSGSGRN
jgi:glycosyltransferase involved in cell wall biosynthesis